MSSDSNLSTEKKSSGSVRDGVAITGWAAALGARRVLSEEVDRAFGMSIGKLRSRAGIVSVSYAAEGETELTLGAHALQQALDVAACPAQEIDWIIASSETHVAYPSLAAQLHKRASARENCGVLDAGGALPGAVECSGGGAIFPGQRPGGKRCSGYCRCSQPYIGSRAGRGGIWRFVWRWRERIYSAQ